MPLLLVAAVAVHALLLGAVVWREGSIDAYAFKSLDATEYYRLAWNLSEKGVFSRHAERPREPDTWRTPGYPVFLAGVMLIAGDSPTTLVLAQQVLAVLNIVLLFGIGARSIGSTRAAAAALLFLLEPYHLYYSLWLLSTTFFVTVLLSTWWVWQRATREPRWYWSLALGVLCGMSVLARPVAGLVPVVVFLGLTVHCWCRRDRPSSRRGSGTERAVRSPSSGAGSPQPWPKAQGASPAVSPPGRFAPLLFVLSCALVVGSWMLRNQRVAGHFALSHQGGVVLAYFKATEVVLWGEGRTEERIVETTLDPRKRDEPHLIWNEFDERLRRKLASLPDDIRATLTWHNLAQGNRTQADPFVVSHALGEVAWMYLTAQPSTTLVCLTIRCGSLLTFPLNLALKPPIGVTGSRWGHLALGLPYTILALWIVARIVTRRISLRQTFFPLACTLALLVATTPQLDPRFRVPMMPLLLLVAFHPSRSGNRSQPLPA